MSPAGWESGLRLLEERVAMLPDLLRRYAAEPPLELSLAGVDRFVTAGIGSSEGHARLLAHLLSERLDFRATYAPLSSVATTERSRRADALVLFSQGLSPNARLALRERGPWRQRIVVTAARDADPEKRRLLDALRAAGDSVVHIPGENEYTTLLRVVGPMAGYLAAHGIARAAAAADGALAPLDVESLCRRIEAAPGAVERSLAAAGLDSLEWLDRGFAFLTFGAYGGLVSNLQYKILEGLYLPMPPVWDLLHFAHGPFQQAFPHPTTFVALARAGEPAERGVLERLREMLPSERHRLVVLEAAEPGEGAICEHEAMLNALVLRSIRERRIDQASWPGKGRDQAIYDLGAGTLSSAGAAPVHSRAPVRRLEDLTWPELERLLEEGCRTAVLALGSTEQHGPHLPFATDTWIGDALAERFCARVPEAVWAPTLPIGCSSEHMGFPGTLDILPSTLAAVVGDVAGSLAAHGFDRVFVFSAHGGNYHALREALPDIRERARPARVLAFLDLQRLTERLHVESAKHGVSAEVAGHHAGELETSILSAIRPRAVRRSELAAGFVEPAPDPQRLFYPSLRDRAATGTVGDPRGASADRAAAYLDAWVDLLVESYLRAKNEK